MEIKKMIGEKPLRVFQCYRMFYGEIPEHKTDENYVELYMKCHAMVTFLSEFGYDIKNASTKCLASPSWHEDIRYFDGLKIFSSLDASIGVINFELEGKSQEYMEEYYQESLRRSPCFDEELTSRIGGIVKEYAETRSMDLIEVLKQMSGILSVKRQLELDLSCKRELADEEIEEALKKYQKNNASKNFEDMLLFLKTKFRVAYESNGMNSILDPSYCKFVKECLPFPEKRKEKVITPN